MIIGVLPVPPRVMFPTMITGIFTLLLFKYFNFIKKFSKRYKYKKAVAERNKDYAPG
jgi:hypothetical protein